MTFVAAHMWGPGYHAQYCITDVPFPSLAWLQWINFNADNSFEDFLGSHFVTGSFPVSLLHMTHYCTTFLLLVIQIRYRTYQTTPPNLVVLVIVLIKWNICAYIFQVNGGHAWPHLGQDFLDVCDPSGVVTGRPPALLPDTVGPPAMSEGHGVHSAPRGEFTWNWKYLSRHCQRWRNLRIVMSSAFTGCHTRLSSSSRDLAVALLCDGWFTTHFWLELHKLLGHLIIGALTQDPQHRPASLIHVAALAKEEPRCTWTLQEVAAVNKEGKIYGTHNNMIMNLCLKEDLMKNGN